MKLADRPRVNLLYLYDEIVIPVKHGQIREINACLDKTGEIDTDKDYTVEIKRKRVKRSLDANAYFWVLVGKLAEKLSTHMSPVSNLDIYRHYIQDYGVYQIVPIPDEGVNEWIRIWGIRGDGWICENLGPCKTVKGYSNIKSYYGTSVYNTKEMSRMIDAIVDDCKEQGIETLSPDKIKRLKEQWGGA